MSKRTTESPMEFEWQSQAPMDITSPFAQLGNRHNNPNMNPNITNDGIRGLKRNHSIFNTSPSKAQHPSLSEPNSQPYLFSSTGTIKPAPAFRNPSFTTPRKFDIDFSSGAENPSSPEWADGEDTPDQKGGANNGLMHFRGGSLLNKDSHTSTTNKPASGVAGLFGKFGASPTPAPGKGEIVSSRKYSTAVSNKVQKRRKREIERYLRKERYNHNNATDDSSESDAHGSGDLQRSRHSSRSSKRDQPSQGQTQSHIPFWSTFFTFLETHPTIPAILSYYAQFICNVSILCFGLWIMWSFAATIRSDVDRASEEATAEIIADMSVCAKSFVENRCGGDNVPPALKGACESWERCMNRDPRGVGRAKVSAKTFAEIFNSFVEPISYKAMVSSVEP